MNPIALFWLRSQNRVETKTGWQHKQLHLILEFKDTERSKLEEKALNLLIFTAPFLWHGHLVPHS